MANSTNEPAAGVEFATLARELVFQPLLGHPGGSGARPAALPAGFRIKVAGVVDSRWVLLASVDGEDDYGVYASASDVVLSCAAADVSESVPAAADPAGHLGWCEPRLCFFDHADKSWIHRKVSSRSVGAAHVQAAIAQAGGEPPALFLDVLGEDGLSGSELVELLVYLGQLQATMAGIAAGSIV